MKTSKKLAFVLICGLVLIISAGCGSKADNNQDHSNMKMDDNAKK